MTPMKLMLCVNDPDSGAETDRLTALEVWHDRRCLIRLECDASFERVRISPIARSALHIDGHLYLIEDYCRCVGNWCWDAADTTHEQVLKLLGRLHKGGATCMEAAPALFDAFQEGKLIGLAALLGSESS